MAMGTAPRERLRSGDSHLLYSMRHASPRSGLSISFGPVDYFRRYGNRCGGHRQVNPEVVLPFVLGTLWL